MSLLRFFYEILCLFASSNFFWSWFAALFFLLLIATTPRIIRELLIWR